MSRLRVLGYTISVDGYGAGPHQSLKHPLGEGGERLHGWLVGTRTFHKMVLDEPGKGSTGPDDEFAANTFENVGAWIMGRNMFAHSRGPWPDDGWKGWWGDDPPYHCDVFVLTHHARAPIPMAGGTTFRFVTGGIHDALDRARAAAAGKDIRIGGGAATVRQYLEAGLVDDLHIAVGPVLLGSGEPLFQGLDLLRLGYAVARHVGTDHATHYFLNRKEQP